MKPRFETIIKHPLFYIILAAFLARLYFLINQGMVWWDSAVYIGMGKHIFSWGAIGMEEFFRPVLWPLILGFAWKIGINPYYFGMLFDLFLNLAAICLTYVIAKKVANRKAAIIAAVLMAISPALIFYSSEILTENLTIVLTLLSVYFLLEKRYSYAGLLAGISVLARYPQGLLLPAFLIFILVFEKAGMKEKTLNSAKTALFFIIPLIGLFLYNFLAFGDVFYQLARAREIVAKVGGFFPEPWHFYFLAVVIESFLAVFFIYAVYLSWKEKNKGISLFIIIFLLFFAYYSSVLRKEIRYLVVVLPALYIPVAYALENVWHQRLFGKRNIKKYIVVTLIIIFAVTSYFNIADKQESFNRPQIPEVMEKFYDEQLLSGKFIISSSPHPAAYLDSKVFVIDPANYYKYLNLSADYCLIYTCDLYCPDEDCRNNRKTFLTILNNTKRLVYKKELQYCSYLLYENA